ncbi:hypothetical protein HQ585_18690 [candidate division KSB1 bacterium]|nr:hypothetical protein [candidate division KSB1 bacterium]
MLNNKFNLNNLTLLFILVFIAVWAGCSRQAVNDKQNNRIIGVKIYNTDENFSDLYDEWNNLGINTVFSSVSLLSQKEFRSLAKKNNIETFVILPIFFNPDTLLISPDLYAITNKGEKAKEEWVEFVCPSREDYRKREIEHIKRLIVALDPDGLSLDFIRHFVFWEKVYPDRDPDSIPKTCLDFHCLNQFKKDMNISIPDSLQNESEIAEWLTNNYLQVWTAWKCDLVTSMIKEITVEAKNIKPEIKINVHAVPWRQNDFDNAIKNVAGQDFSQISAAVDILSPMTYAHMVKRKPAWIHSVVQDIANQTECRIVPSIQVNKAYLNEPVTLEEFKQSVIEALKPPSSGVIFWSWEQLKANPEKLQILKLQLSSNLTQ